MNGFSGLGSLGSSGGSLWRPGGGGDLTFDDQVKLISNGGLLLADAVFTDAAAPIVTSATQTYQGLQVVSQGSAGATIDTLNATQGAVWLWSLGGTFNLAKRPYRLYIRERDASVFPSLVTYWCGFCDNGNPRDTAAGNGWGGSLGWPATTQRQLHYLAKAGAAWSRTAGTAAVTYFGGDVDTRPHTHTDVAQGRVYPVNASGERSSSATGAAGSTVQIEGRMTHFFVAKTWNSTSGATPTTVIDAGYWIGEETLAA